jgi:[methyl-Co(III) methanol-specific corrinoid protein]:coenzyme M methyltransferase
MDIISPKERLLCALNKKAVDRAPVICPGGMMNSAIVEIMEKTGNTLPKAHHTGALMAALSEDVQSYTGFENYGVPFCMTVEAEALGSEINFGSLKCEPKIEKEVFKSVNDVVFKENHAIEKSERAQAMGEAVYTLARKKSDVPIIGSLTGPLSTAASIVDPMTFLKQLRKEKAASHKVLDYVTNQLADFAKMLVQSGADVISIADPTATGEILGPKMFSEYAVLYLNRLNDEIKKLGVPVIVHICGKMQAVTESIAKLHADAISVDAFVSLTKLKAKYPSITTMGNFSTYMLEFAQTPAVEKMAEKLLLDKIEILAPACGLSTSTPLKNITAFTGRVKDTL